jgi:hypothetical protein
VSILILAIAVPFLAIMAGAGLWLLGRNAPIFRLSDPIQPDGKNDLDNATLQAYAAQVQAATGGQDLGTRVRRRLLLSLTGLAMLLGAVAGTLWVVQG